MHGLLPNRQTNVNTLFAPLAFEHCGNLANDALAMKAPRQIRLRELIKETDLTLEDLAERTGLSVSYLSRMGSGDRRVNLNNLNKIASALGVAPSALLLSEDMSEFHASNKIGLTQGKKSP